MRDKDASRCKLCEKEFSISRRKVGPRALTRRLANSRR